jgi:glutaredoxin
MSSETALVMYCRSWCPDCARARRWLDAKGIAYDAIDIEESESGADRVREIAGKIVTPTFEMGERTCVDFDEGVLEDMLGL